jgi:hypothetical protein
LKCILTPPSNIEGHKNLAADAFSRLPFSERQDTTPRFSRFSRSSSAENAVDDELFYAMATDDAVLGECFVHLPDQYGVPFRLDYPHIAQAQLQRAALMHQRQAQPQRILQRLMRPGLSHTVILVLQVARERSIFPTACSRTQLGGIISHWDPAAQPA